MKNIKRTSFILLLIATLLITGCTGETQNQDTETEAGSSNVEKEKETIIVGTAAHFLDMLEEGKKVFDENSEDYVMEVVLFDDFTMPNTALAEGSIHANFFQHIPFLDAYNESNNTDLVMYQDKMVVTTSETLCSLKIESIDEIQEGDKIGLSNDPSNLSIGLLLLDELGLIKLKDGVDSPDLLDVEENPLNLELLQIGNGRDILNALEDITAGYSTGGQAIEAGLEAENIIAVMPPEKLPDYESGITVRPEDNDAPWAEEIYKALTSDEIIEYLHETYPNAIIPISDYR